MRQRPVILCLILFVVTCGLYAPSLQNDFVNFDDRVYVTENPHVQAGLTADSIKWAFGSAGYASNWHPLTWLSHELDCQLFGTKAAGPHAVNILFHALNSALLLLLLWRMTGAVWRSALVAALFAWHPLHVESVAWISERKDVLSAFFCLLSLLAYVRYASEFKVQGSKFKVFYGLSLLLFVCGLMSKPMLVTVPIVMLLLDYWPLRRISELRLANGDLEDGEQPRFGQVNFRQAIIEKAPFLALALISSFITIAAQHAGGSVASLSRLPITSRITMALVSYCRYIAKLFWPEHLSAYYPPVAAWPPWMVAGSMICIAAACMYVWQHRRSRPHLAVGWCWFLIMLLPVIGLVQVGTQAMADRYTYLPAIGVFIMVAWELGRLAKAKVDLKWAFGAASAVVLAACLVLTRNRVYDWHDSGRLFEQSLKVAPANNFMAHALLGTYLNEHGEAAKAEPHFVEALSVAPTFPIAQYGMGFSLAAQHKLTNAVEHFERAIEAYPGYEDAYRELGMALNQLGRADEALTNFSLAIKFKPDDAAAHFGRGVALSIKGQPDAALADFEETVRLKPDWPSALNNLAWILATSADDKIRNGTRAVELAGRACQLTERKQALFIGTLAAAYAEAGRFKEAVATGQEACNLALAAKEQAVAERNLQLLELYRANKPFHESPPKTDSH